MLHLPSAANIIDTSATIKITAKGAATINITPTLAVINTFTTSITVPAKITVVTSVTTAVTTVTTAPQNLTYSDSHQPHRSHECRRCLHVDTLATPLLPPILGTANAADVKNNTAFNYEHSYQHSAKIKLIF
jgi:hypothetical protein